MIREFFIRFNNIKIKTKLIISYFILMVVTITVIYRISAVRINNELLMQASNDMNYSTQQIKENIVNLIHSYEKATDYIAFNKTFLSNITQKHGNVLIAYDKTKEAKEIIKLLMDLDNTILSVSVRLYNDNVLFDGKTFIRGDREKVNDDFDKGSLLVWSGTQKNANNISIIRLDRIIYDYTSAFEKVGILTFEIPESRFFEYIKKESISKKIAIFNKNEELVTASDKEFFHNLEEKYLKQTRGQDQGNFTYTDDNCKNMLCYSTAPNGWKVISVIPVDRLLARVYEIDRYVTIVIIVSFIIVMTITYFILDMLTKRLTMLTKAVHRVGEGKYDFKINETSNDEIGQLACDFNKMTEKLHFMFNKVYVAEINMKESELRALQAQINPHFLYNVLSTIGYIALKKNVPEIRKVTSALANFYRFSLSRGNSIVTLEEEIAHVKIYADIQKVRFGDRLAVAYDIDEKLRGYKILKLLIQPFVENCINHGMKDGETRLNIRISAYIEAENALIEITDDGIGISQEKINDILGPQIESDNRGYGIQNVIERIKLHFGDEYGIRITSEQGAGTKILIVLPL